VGIAHQKDTFHTGFHVAGTMINAISPPSILRGTTCENAVFMVKHPYSEAKPLHFEIVSLAPFPLWQWTWVSMRLSTG